MEIKNKKEYDILEIEDISEVKSEVKKYIDKGVNKKDVSEMDVEKGEVIKTIKKSYFSLLSFYVGYLNYDEFLKEQEEIEEKILELEDKNLEKAQSMREVPPDMIKTRMIYSSFPQPVLEFSYWLTHYLFKNEISGNTMNQTRDIFKKSFKLDNYNIKVQLFEFEQGNTRVNYEIYADRQKE